MSVGTKKNSCTLRSHNLSKSIFCSIQKPTTNFSKMYRFCLLVLALIFSLSNGFVPVSRTFVPKTIVFEQDTMEETTYSTPVKQVERGVSVDQDGKSNVWAIEPKMELSDKSDEEKTTSALVAGGGLAAFAVLAGVILTNLPDPNQF